jgi:hypothetical protein
VYDLKNRNVISFNMKSLEAMLARGIGPNLSDGFFEVALSIFNESSDSEEFKSYLPLPLDSPWNTALPWFSYTLLRSPNSLDSAKLPNIAELFLFGTQPNPKTNNAFDFKPFSIKEDGYATCIFHILDKSKKSTYTVRYDQSKGQRLVHLDYSVYNEKTETKIISHEPLDLEEVYKFSEDLYIAITGAGLFDGYFCHLY